MPSRIQPRARWLVDPHSCARSAPAPATCRSRWRSGSVRAEPPVPSAAAPPASRRRRRRPATGSIAGARSPRGNSRPTACITASAGVRGAKVKSTDRLRALGQARQRATPRRRRGNGSASPSRPRGRTGRAPDRACRRRETRSLPAPRSRGTRSRARPTSVGDRSIATTSRAAPRRLDRERAGAAAGIEQPRAAQVVRQPVEQRARASRRGRRGPWRGCGRPARRRSAAPRHRPRCGRNRSRARPRRSQVGQAAASVEPQQVEDVAVLHRRGRQRLACRPRASAASRRYSSCTASSSGDGSISNSVDFFSRLRRITSRSGKCAMRLQADLLVVSGRSGRSRRCGWRSRRPAAPRSSSTWPGSPRRCGSSRRSSRNRWR